MENLTINIYNVSDHGTYLETWIYEGRNEYLKFKHMPNFFFVTTEEEQRYRLT